MKKYTTHFVWLLIATILQSSYALYWSGQGNEAKYFHEDLLAIIMQCTCFMVYAIDNIRTIGIKSYGNIILKEEKNNE